jgi:hypothetical protein
MDPSNSTMVAEPASLIAGPVADTITLHPLPAADAARWDELIAAYPDRQVFHCQAWLDYLAASRGARIRKWSITGGGARLLGYFCAGQVSRGPFRILGSPLRGWGTNSMGPLLGAREDLTAFLTAIDDLARSERLAMVELEHPGLDPAPMEVFGYTATTLWTYRVELDPDEQVMLKRMPKGRRSGIKKAINSGLIVEPCNDLALADEYYDQFCAVMRRKGLAPTYAREVPRLLMEALTPTGRLLALRVRHPDGRTLATGLFPYDNGVLYFWGGASVPERELCPNDLLHWRAMCLAAKLGLLRYDLSGWGRFKKEFGGELVTVRRWHKCYSRNARWARRAYESYSRQKQRIVGLVGRVLHERKPSAEGGPRVAR